MEKFFMKRWTIAIETWQAGLLVVAAILGLVGFGALVDHAARNPYHRGLLASAAYPIARFPAAAQRVWKEVIGRKSVVQVARERIEGKSGFQRLKPGGSGAFLLLSRMVGETKRPDVEVVNLENGAVIRRYSLDLVPIFKKSKVKFVNHHFTSRTPVNYIMNHPLPMNDGGIVFNTGYGPLIRVDACSKIEWVVDGAFHHSGERDADGNIWAPSTILPPKTRYMPAWGFDDAITKISPDGRILLQKSVSDILIANGLKHIVYSHQYYSDDPIHLNEVQPVLDDGPFWKRGDLFLSLRHASAVMLYRPSTNKVIWVKQGPWLKQHDVEILNDHEISVFDNNTAQISYKELVLGTNNVVIYDFETGETRRPYNEGFKKNDIRTIQEGRSRILPDGDVFVEETNYGRLLKINASGDVAWRYINRGEDGAIYPLLWSRYLEPPYAAKFASAVQNAKCEATQ
ncbi:MAG: arylsulfotransferase family protein [Parvularculaceae bacterium]